IILYFSSRRRHTRSKRDWSSDVCSSDLKFQNSSMTDKNIKSLRKYVEAKPYGFKSKDKLIPIISTSENTYKSITSIFNERMTLRSEERRVGKECRSRSTRSQKNKKEQTI